MRHWVFDLDGTLVDSFSHYFDALDEIFADHSKRFTPELRHAALTEQLDGFFSSHLGKGAVPGAFKKLQSRSNADAARIKAFDGVAGALEALRARGSRVAVWTNRDLTSAKLILEHTGLDQYIDSCVSGTCVSERKPHPEGLARIIQGFGCGPGEVTMVGDHEHDVTAAKQIGVRAVRASWHAYWNVEECAHADFQFFRFAEFSKWALQEGLKA